MTVGAARTLINMRTLLILQLIAWFTVAWGSAAGEESIDGLLVGFSIKGASERQANSTAFRQAVAQTAGVPVKSVTVANATKAFHTTRPHNGVTGVAFEVAVVNLAAPYAALTALSADKALRKALDVAGARYVIKSLQVSAPAWIIQTQELPDTDSSHTRMSFTMSGVPLPAVDQFRLRAVVATVAGVRIEAVRVKTISYAVAPPVKPPPSGRKLLGASGYYTLQVVVGVDTAAAAEAGLLGAATVSKVLARQLKLVLGATYNEGSLLIDQMMATKEVKGVSKSGRNVNLGVTLGVSLAMLLIAAICMGAVILWYRRKAVAAAASGEHPLSKLSTDIPAPQQEMALTSDIAGVKPILASV